MSCCSPAPNSLPQRVFVAQRFYACMHTLVVGMCVLTRAVEKKMYFWNKWTAWKSVYTNNSSYSEPRMKRAWSDAICSQIIVLLQHIALCQSCWMLFRHVKRSLHYKYASTVCRSGESWLQITSLLLFPYCYLICVFTYFNKLGKKCRLFTTLQCLCCSTFFLGTWEMLFTMILQIPSLLTYLAMPQKKKIRTVVIFLSGTELSEAPVL